MAEGGVLQPGSTSLRNEAAPLLLGEVLADKLPPGTIHRLKHVHEARPARVWQRVRQIAPQEGNVVSDICVARRELIEDAQEQVPRRRRDRDGAPCCLGIELLR